jgi:hypothetical protein
MPCSLGHEECEIDHENQFNLKSQINFDSIQVMNGTILKYPNLLPSPQNIEIIFQDENLIKITHILSSTDDCDLIINIPFISLVKIHSISLTGFNT